MTNTIPNVPRELKPCPFCGGEPNLTTADYVHDDLTPMPVVECKSCSAWVQADDWNTRAQSPAGVDGLNTDRNAAFKACPESGCDWGSFYLGWKARGEVEQAIIDGLRDQIHVAHEKVGRYADQRDQQAQRIGELEGLLREVAATLAWIAHGECRAIHDGPIMPSQMALDVAKAALSAGKEWE